MTPHHSTDGDPTEKMRGAASDGKFRKNEHLLKKREFDKVYRKGLAHRLGGVVFYSFPNDLAHNRLGFSIGSRNVRRAVARNRIRRLFKEAYRKNKGRLKAGFDLVIVVKKDMSKDMSYTIAETTLLDFAKNTRLII